MEGPEAISGYLDMLDMWYSDHREEISQDDYTRFQTKLEGCKGVWVTKASHVVVIGMVRQAKDKRAAEWEEIAAVACSVQNMHLALHLKAWSAFCQRQPQSRMKEDPTSPLS